MADPSMPSADRLLARYDLYRRNLSWRALPGVAPDPYRVWLSEIMLQQTTVVTVAPYYGAFLARWPIIEGLARADLDDVLHAWQGLGYYARARNMHKCAVMVAGEYGGRFPDTEAGLRALPGIGAYTAAAIAAIAFERPATVVDGNVERVMARLFAGETPLPTAKTELKALAADLTPTKRPGDYAQAVMDLGATVCTPRNPDCGRCPWADGCMARATGMATDLPRRLPRKARPLRRGLVFWAVRCDGAVLLRRRPEQGLLGGMIEVPSTPWKATGWTLSKARFHAPLEADWRRLKGVVNHGFTHFELELAVVAATIEGAAEGQWCRPECFADLALPTLTKKVVSHVLDSPPLTDA